MNIKYLSLALSLSLMSSAVSAATIVDEQNLKAVGKVKWKNQLDVDADSLLNQEIPEDSVSIFFLRQDDNDLVETSANVAINDRFQVSLHPGSYTQVYSCSGINRISTEITDKKSNDLLLNPVELNLESNKKYFFDVDVNDYNKTSVTQLSEQEAIERLAGKKYQSHQITRVVPNCPPAQPVVKIEPKPVPVLEQEVSMELEVLFDNDKAIVKPEYYGEVQELAEFMQKYSNTTVIIEGHTDSNASDEYNQKLSERRANAIRNILISKFNISPERLSAIGYGEQRPRATNNTAEGRQLNRRTIAVIKERVSVDQNGNQVL